MATVTILTLIVGVLMTPGSTTPCRQVADRCMTLAALRPTSIVVARIDPEPRCIMVHRVRRPHTRAMAHGAVMGELLCHMVRIRHLLEVCLMALIAICVHKLVVPIDVT
jgi:transposase